MMCPYSLPVVLGFVHPYRQTRVGGPRTILLLTFFLRFAGSIVTDIVLLCGHNANQIERYPTASCDPYTHFTKG